MNPQTEMLYELFGTTDETQQAQRLTRYVGEINKSTNEGNSGRQAWDPATKTILKGHQGPAGQQQLAEIVKAFTGASAGLTPELQQMAQQMAQITGVDLQKDWTPTNPVSLVPYDLQGPAKELVPLQTPIRNTLPREVGQGAAAQWRTIDSFTNANVAGGAANLSPFFNSSTVTSTWGGPGNLTLNRPQKISYTGSNQIRSYVELGFSDQVNWKAQFQSLGFENLRGLSNHVALWSHLMGEEQAILYGRGAVAGGYSGAIAAPTNITTGNTASGGTVPDATYYVYVKAFSGFGYSAASAVVNTGALAGGGDNTFTVTVGTEPTGALSYGYWIGTATGIANAKYQGTFPGNSKVFTAYDAAGAVTTQGDTSEDVNAYDGFLTVLSGSQSGYFSRVNGGFSTSNSGAEFNQALLTMWRNNRAAPSQFWMDAQSIVDFSELTRIGGSSGALTGYRTVIQAGDGNMMLGAAVSSFMNPVTRKPISLEVHPFMPEGVVLMRSTSLPVPNSEVTAPTAARDVQPYMAIAWPGIQMTNDISTYQLGTLVHYAPKFSGLLVGITPNED
jgi:hypothetical protein